MTRPSSDFFFSSLQVAARELRLLDLMQYSSLRSKLGHAWLMCMKFILTKSTLKKEQDQAFR